MKRMLLTTAAVCAAMCFALTAQATTYYVVADGNWTQQIWNTTGSGTPDLSDPSPGPTDEVRVCAGYELTITAGKSAGYITLDQGSAGNQTKIIVGSDGTLTLSGTTASTINSYAAIELSSATSVLANSDSHTITGSGAIHGQHASAQVTIASSKTLTSQTTIEGAMRIEPVSGTATFVNGSGGSVRANRAGTLDIRPGTVTGAGAWEVSTDDDAVLQFTTGSQSLSGNFTVTAGTLDILADVSTTGTLDCQQSPTFSAPEIHVSSGHTFSAGQ